jgi:hypothetical protein
MTKTDQLFLKYSSIIIIIASVFYYLTLEHLIHHGNSSSSVLLYRGIITFSITVLLSLKSRQRIVPANINQQLLRMAVSGTALLMIFQSYKYLEASTVCMIARLDIPFAVLIGFVLGKRKVNFKVGLSLFAFLLVLSIFFFAKHIGEGIPGLALAIMSILMLSVSYTLVKKSTDNENNFVILNTTNLGGIAVGLLGGLIFGNLNAFHLADIWIFLLASTSQFLLNYTMCVLYRNREIEHGQRPYLVAALVLLIVEQLCHGFLFDAHHTAIIILVIGVIYLITLKKLPVNPKWMEKRQKTDHSDIEVLDLAIK